MIRKPVTQEHLSGCAVACIAFLLNIPYTEALSILKDGPEKAKLRGFYCQEVMETLRTQGLICKNQFVRKHPPASYEPNTIMYLKKSAQYPAGHYLAYDGNSWMDPWINFPDLPIRSGFRQELPGDPHYIIVPVK